MNDYPVRKNLRLKNYDYSNKGYYYITIVTKNRHKILSTIENNKIHLSDIGKIVNDSITYLCNKKIDIPTYIITPNHIHMILGTLDYDGSLFDIVRNFKMHTARLVNKNYNIRLWQRSYYETIIQSEIQYQAFFKYIVENPMKWSLDEYNK